jgi:phenylacetate-coenzyme A ligase PaaK-like adenylate-forming protein
VEVYKSSESFIALPCKDGKLHINEDTTLVEVLDKNNQPVKPGEPGFVVVTDFINA